MKKMDRPLTAFPSGSHHIRNHTPSRMADRSATRIAPVGRMMTPPLASSHHRHTSPAKYLETIDRMGDQLLKLQ